MTSIVYDGKYLAADRQITAGSFIIGYEKKIQRWSKGYFAIAGATRYVEPFRNWLEKKTKFQPAKKLFNALYTIGKKIYYVDEELIPYKAFIPYAIGDSADVAEGLARTGLSAREVVKEMCKQCISVGGRVDVIQVV